MHEPDLDLDLEHWAVHYIQVSGYSKNKRVNYYYGLYRVILPRSPSAASDALSCFKDMINVPNPEQQFYTVFDMYGNLIENVFPSPEYDFKGYSITRREFHKELRPRDNVLEDA